MSLQNKKITILVSAFNDSIYDVVENMIPSIKKHVNVTVSHQVTDRKFILNDKNIYDFKYSVINSVGLSKNRNNCLKLADRELNLFADDDVKYLENFSDKIIHAFNELPDADIILFQEKDKVRFKKIKKLGFLSAVKSPSWLLVYRKKSLDLKKIKFNEEFGVGAKYPIGEDNIFLRDCYKAGLVIYSHPSEILIHKDISSGFKTDSNKIIEARVMLYREMFGVIGSFLSVFYFSFFKKNIYKERYNMSEYFFLSSKYFIRNIIKYFN